MASRVMVFVDYQNVYLSAFSCFHTPGARRSRAHIDPVALGKLLVHRRRHGGQLVDVRVHRGYPDPNREATAAAANDRQAVRWELDGATVIRRPLRYPASWPASPPQEKGVDLALGIDFVRCAFEMKYDVGILCSRDSDLLPAIETVLDLNLAHVEVASWTNESRLRIAGTSLPWCHYLDEADFRAVHDPTDYTRPSS